MSRDTSRRKRDAHWATDEPKPFDAPAPRAAKHARKRAHKGLHKRGQRRIHEFARAPTADRELEARENNGERRIAEIEETINIGGAGRSGELDGDSIRGERERGKPGRRGTLEHASSLDVRTESLNISHKVLHIRGLELELLVGLSISCDTFAIAVRGLERGAIHWAARAT